MSNPACWSSLTAFRLRCAICKSPRRNCSCHNVLFFPLLFIVADDILVRCSALLWVHPIVRGAPNAENLFMVTFIEHSKFIYSPSTGCFGSTERISWLRSRECTRGRPRADVVDGKFMRSVRRAGLIVNESRRFPAKAPASPISRAFTPRTDRRLAKSHRGGAIRRVVGFSPALAHGPRSIQVFQPMADCRSRPAPSPHARARCITERGMQPFTSRHGR